MEVADSVAISVVDGNSVAGGRSGGCPGYVSTPFSPSGRVGSGPIGG